MAWPPKREKIRAIVPTWQGCGMAPARVDLKAGGCRGVHRPGRAGFLKEAVLSRTLQSEFQQTEMQRKGRLRGQAGPTGPRSSRRCSEAAVRKVLEEGTHPAPEHLSGRQPGGRGYGCSGKKGRFWPQT